MIDWYILLFIGFFVLIIFIEKIGAHRSVHEYMVTSRELGLSAGTYGISLQFISGVTVVVPALSMQVFRLSTFPLLIICICGLYLLLYNIITNDKVKQVTDAEGNSHLWFFAFSSMASLFVQFTILAYFLLDLLSVVGTAIFICFCFVFFGLGGSYGVRKIGSSLFYVTFLVMVIVTLFLYLGEGVQTIYNTYQGEMFSGNITDVIFASMTFVLVVFGQACTNLSFWQTASAVKSNHRITVLRLSTFIWFAFMISIFAFSFFLFVQKQAVEQMNQVIIHVMIFISLGALSIGIGTSLFSLISVFLKIKSRGRTNQYAYRLLRHGYLIGVIACSLLDLMAILLSDSMSEWLPFLLGFFASAGCPFIIGRTFRAKDFTMIMLIMTVVSIGLTIWIKEIWLVAPIAAMIGCFLSFVLEKLK